MLAPFPADLKIGDSPATIQVRRGYSGARVASEIPEPVQRFIARHIHSVEKLEILLLLAGEPGRSFTPEAVFRIIQSQIASVTERLEEMLREGFLIREGPPPSYRYHPPSEEIRHCVEDLGAVYKEKRIKVVEMIFSNPVSRIQTFADAFIIRKDKPNG